MLATYRLLQLSLTLVLCNFSLEESIPKYKGEYHEATVYIDPSTQKLSYKFDVIDKVYGTAYGYYNNTLNSTGWTILELRSGNRHVKDTDVMYAAGFLEGLLTARQIWQNFVNLRSAMIEKHNTTKLKEFYSHQDRWMRSMILSHPKNEDAFWRHVSYVVAQFDGLYAGYKTVAQPEWETDLFVIQFLNGIGDLIDLQHVLEPHTRPVFSQMTNEQFLHYVLTSGHCSALVKVTPGYENILMSHSSWFVYASTLRIFKHYHFDIQDPDIAVYSLSFSSYPGFIESLDDFYLLDNDLVVLQTTNNIFNMSLYDTVTPHSLFAWQRVRVANMLSRTGQDWFQTVALYNSGTYNNQYMIIDLHRVRLRESLLDGTLWIIEQIPGLIVGTDQTAILRTGYWPSYNVPFHELIYSLSGYPEIVKQRGLDYSYQLAPRAKIFRRDQALVTDLLSMQTIMRYNDYQHDEYSEEDSCNTICCRGDLRTVNAAAFGCYDTKIADFQMAMKMTSHIINGPTTSHNLKPFSWSGPFVNTSHVGLPEVYNFDWIDTSPQL